MTATARRALSSVPSKTRSEATVSYRPPDLSPVSDDSSSSDESDDEDDWETLSMNPGDIRVIRRISKRANVLPVVARADSLTNDKLASIKKVIRRDLDAAGLDFGVFGPINDPLGTAKQESKEPTTNGAVHSGSGGGGSGGVVNGVNGHFKHQSMDGKVESTPDADSDERPSRNIIKLRANRHTKSRASQSRSRIDLSESANEPSALEITDTESVASVRFSAQIVSKSDLAETLPFALITPQHSGKRKNGAGRIGLGFIGGGGGGGGHHTQSVLDDQSIHQVDSVLPSEDGHPSSSLDSHHGVQSPVSPSPASSRVPSYLAGPPADLKGVFVRKFRWGTVDVLNPEHCDYAALRTAILSTHMKVRPDPYYFFVSLSLLVRKNDGFCYSWPFLIALFTSSHSTILSLRRM